MARGGHLSVAPSPMPRASSHTSFLQVGPSPPPPHSKARAGHCSANCRNSRCVGEQTRELSLVVFSQKSVRSGYGDLDSFVATPGLMSL